MQAEDIVLFDNLYEDFRSVREEYINFLEKEDKKNQKKLKEKYKNNSWILKKFYDLDKLYK